MLFSSLSFTVQPATALHIKGANGRGKTSLLRILSGLRQPDQGTVMWNGASIFKDRTLYLENISYQGHEIGLKGDLNAIENLEFFSRMKTETGNLGVDKVLQRLDVDHVSMLPCSQLSAGQRQRIAIARTVLSGARLWILDEPGTALDQAGLQVFESILTEHIELGGMVIFTSHHDFRLDSINHRNLSLDQYSG